MQQIWLIFYLFQYILSKIVCDQKVTKVILPGKSKNKLFQCCSIHVKTCIYIQKYKFESANCSHTCHELDICPLFLNGLRRKPLKLRKNNIYSYFFILDGLRRKPLKLRKQYTFLFFHFKWFMVFKVVKNVKIGTKKSLLVGKSLKIL